MATVTSADGTGSAYTVTGSGPTLIYVGGAIMCFRSAGRDAVSYPAWAD